MPANPVDSQQPHRRFNPLLREWVLVSPHRTQRPWQGQQEKPTKPAAIEYDPSCYLCPGNTRAGGKKNPTYEHTFVFDNDYAALLPDTPVTGSNQSDLLVSFGESGVCRVICFSPRHDLTLARMKADEIRRVVDVWVEQYQDLGAKPFINYVEIFENRGEMMGASNPHPHCQVWSTHSIPDLPQREQDAMRAYRKSKDSCLLCDYLALEEKSKDRVVCDNEHFTAVVPYWAVWPFEALVLAKRHYASMCDMTNPERDGLADILKQITTRYDNLFEITFPYSMGFHQAPTDGEPHDEAHFHAHFYPPLLRSATVRKFMVGFEMLGMPQRDVTAEQAAARLRELPAEHYLEKI